MVLGIHAVRRPTLAEHKTHSRNNPTRNHTLFLFLLLLATDLLTLAAWDVRSLLDNSRSNRPERRTALLAREMAPYKVGIAALSKTRFCEQGQLKELGAGYTFFWNGHPRAERWVAGVDFVIQNEILGRLPCPPRGISNHLIGLHLPLRGGKFATIVSVHAPP
ncbi:hypothetical protein SprV_0100108200 [Sparganum proliferum]